MAGEEVTRMTTTTEKARSFAARNVSAAWFFILLFAATLLYLVWTAILH
jgi:hypothetical protein